MRVKYLDVLKAFAIIAVVLYHAGIMTYGYLGVDLFLVIAGYLTTKSLISKSKQVDGLAGGGRFYAQFELNRIVRLLPPLLMACLVCLAIGFFVMIDNDLESLSQSVIATSFFGNNIVELIATGDYWAVSKNFSPLMHTWYVGVVMQFYLLLPLLYLLTFTNKKNPQKTFLTLVAIFGVISLLIFIGDNDTARKFYLLPARFFEFAVGSIVALTYKPQQEKCFNRYFVYGCYILLLVLFAVNSEIIPSNVKLLSVVVLSCVMLCSRDILENRVTGNAVLAKVGAASYSIFIWHQIVLAFYRSFYGNNLSIMDYTICLGIVIIVSWTSYQFVEQRTGKLLKTSSGTRKFYIVYGGMFIALMVFSAVIYKNAGVVRDIPELEVYRANPQRGMWAHYNSANYKYDKPFETKKVHWLVIGNSFGRDFVNIIKESELADSVEVSYCDVTAKNYLQEKYLERFKEADRIFVASKNFTEEMVREIEIRAMAYGHTKDDVIIVGDKSFGATMTQVYTRRFRDDYFQTKIKIADDLRERNEKQKKMYGSRFVDLYSILDDGQGNVRAFTDEGMFISSDCIHLTRAGAKFFSDRISWSDYIK